MFTTDFTFPTTPIDTTAGTEATTLYSSTYFNDDTTLSFESTVVQELTTNDGTTVQVLH